MINKLLYKLTARLPCRIISIGGQPYLERYSVGKFFGVSFYLHRFVGSASEENVHDHPWKWAKSFILTGAYIEEVVHALDIDQGWISSRYIRRWFNNLGPNVFHRIIDVSPGTWTLFVHGKRFKSWGFLSKECDFPGIEDPYVKYYQPFNTAQNAGWDERAPLGRDAGRMPL